MRTLLTLRGIRAAMSLALFLGAAGSIWAQVPYRLTDLGPAVPAALDDSGRAVGTYLDAGGFSRAFLFTPGKGRTDIGTLGGPGADASDINGLGQVTGGTVDASGQRPAYVYTPGAGMMAVMTDPFGSAAGLGINDHGQVAGMVNVLGEVPVPFLYTPGQGVTLLGSFGGQSGSATAVNRLGHVVGSSEDLTLGSAAFLWTPQSGLTRLHPEDAGGFAADINDRDEITGSFLTDEGFRAFLHTPESGSVSLGTLEGDTRSRGNALNERLEVVGESATATASRAFLWTPTLGMRSLQEWLAPGSGEGWILQSATDINELGQISGWGQVDGQLHGFILTPVPEPTTAALLALGLVALTLRRFCARRRPDD